MDPLALCALLAISCAAPKVHVHHEVMGMVGGMARAAMQADWDATANNPKTPERMYEVVRDSTAIWAAGPTGIDTLIVLYVLEVKRVPAKYADPLHIVPLYMPVNPTIHTHKSYCRVTHWGPELDTCSDTIPESNQCRPSIQDQRVQALEGHPYDIVMCGRAQWVFFLPKERQ